MKKTLLASSILAALSSTTSVAFAEENTLVVTASRVDQLSSLPASVTIISAEDIANSPARTLPELLAAEAGINTRSLFNHGSRASIGLRGFGATSTLNTLILLDGRRLNDIDLSNVNYAAIPFENIERIEILRGTGSVIYGDGATGGTINIITKDPRQAANHSTLDLTTGSYDHREINLSTSYSNEKFGLSANLNSQQNDGYRDHNAFDQNSGQIDIRIPLNKSEVYAKIGVLQNNNEFPGARKTAELVSDRRGTATPNDWADEYTEYMTLGYSLDLQQGDTLILDGGYRRKKTRAFFEDYNYGGFYNSYSESSISTLSLTPRLLLAREVAGYSVDWLLGADLYLYDYSSNGSKYKANIGQPFSKKGLEQESAAVYAQGTFLLSEKTSVTAGMRLQRVRQKGQHFLDSSAPGGNSDTAAPAYIQSDVEESYELGIKHLFNKNWSGFARFDRSARFGTVDELLESTYNPSTFSSIFDFSRLKPQVSKSLEMGVNFKNDWLTSTLAVFHQKLTNEIYYDVSAFENVNLDDTQRDGIELSATAKLNQMMTLKGAYTFLSAEFAEGSHQGNEIPLVPRHTYNLSLITQLPLEVTAAVNWNYVSSTLFDNDPTNSFGESIPSYQTVDLKLSKTIAALEIALQLNNIFDEKYYNYGISSPFAAGAYNAYSLPERNGYLSVSYTFK